MILNNWRFCLLLVLAMVCGGCNALMGSLAAQVPSIRGTWRGRVIPVTVYDDHRRAFKAAALDVNSGPNIAQLNDQPGLNASDLPGGGSKPLLTRWDNWCSLINPSSLPEGHWIEVTGRMMVLDVDVDREGVRVSRERTDGRPMAEHVIIVNGTIKIDPQANLRL